MENPYELEDQLILKNDDGIIGARVALLMTFYLEEGHSHVAKQRVLAFLKESYDLIGEHLTFLRHPKSDYPKRIKKDALASVSKWITENDERQEYEFVFKGGENADDASHFEFSGFGTASWKSNTTSYVQLVVPITFFADRPIDIVKRFCDQLNPLSGYVGLGIVPSNNSTIAQITAPSIYAMARRFEGLEVDQPHRHTLHVSDGIKSVNWMTIVGSMFIEKIGGAEKLTKALGRDMVIELENSVIIVASDKPQMGDTNRQILVDDYRKVAKVLKPIMITTLGSFYCGSPLGFTREKTIEWLNRFK